MVCVFLQITRIDGLQENARQSLNVVMKFFRPIAIVVYVYFSQRGLVSFHHAGMYWCSYQY